MENKAAPKRKGRPIFMVGATTTTISIEERLLTKVRKLAYKNKQSASQWIVEAMAARLEKEAAQ